MAVNTLVAMEVFYLFSVRYLKAPSFTLVGVQGTPRVLLAVGAVVVLQALFTYAPFMQTWFGTRALQPGRCCCVRWPDWRCWCCSRVKNGWFVSENACSPSRCAVRW
jgi:hypothetical protein